MQSVLRLGRERKRLATSGPLFIYLMKSSFPPGLGIKQDTKKLFWWEGSQEPSGCSQLGLKLLRAERQSEMKRAFHTKTRCSRNRYLEIANMLMKPVRSNCCLLLSGGRRFSLRCLCFGCWCAGAAGPCHLQVGVALDCAHSLSNEGRPRRGFLLGTELFLAAGLVGLVPAFM